LLKSSNKKWKMSVGSRKSSLRLFVPKYTKTTLQKFRELLKLLEYFSGS
jgi:hypothetical protein